MQADENEKSRLQGRELESSRGGSGPGLGLFVIALLLLGVAGILLFRVFDPQDFLFEQPPQTASEPVAGDDYP